MAGAPLPSFNTTTVSGIRVLVDLQGKQLGEDVILDSGNTDSGSTPTHRFRPGNVVVLRTSTGRYVEANDSNGDVNTAASITSSGHSDGNGVIAITGNHGSISVTTTTGTGTEANNATDLNGDADFAAHYTASSAGGELTIASNNVGADEWFYVQTATMATAGFSEGVDNGVIGADADYRVTCEHADLQDENATAVHAPAANYWAGHFDLSSLVNLTAEARATLVRRGSRFSS